MVFWVVAGSIVLIFLIKWFLGSSSPPSQGKRAPGPKSWPVAGSALQVDFDNMHLTFDDWKKKYGDVVYAKLFSREMILLNSWSVVKEAMVNQADNFSARPQMFVFDSIMGGKRSGIINNDGWKWKEQRGYAVSLLRDFGMGRSVMEEKINYEQSELFAELDRQMQESPSGINPVIPVRVAMANVVGNVLMSKRHAYDDKRILKFFEANDHSFEKLTPQMALDFMPALRPLLPWLPWMFNKDETEALTKYCTDYLEEIIAEHQATLSDDQAAGKASDYLYAYLGEMKKRADSPDQESNTFTHHQLVWNLRDLYIAGFDTIVTTLNWFFVFVCHQPEVLRKVREEIERETGGATAWADRSHCHYTMATVIELQRRANIGPIGVFHSVFHDTTVNGYTVPKDCMVVINHYSVMLDEELFDKPYDFNPDRFIDAEGKFTNRPDGIIPFSIGKRMCPGAEMAKMELFLFIAAFCLRYDVLPTAEGPPSMENPITGHTLAPRPYKVRLVRRE